MKQPVWPEVDVHRLTEEERKTYSSRSRELAPEIADRRRRQAKRAHLGFGVATGVGAALFATGLAVHVDGIWAAGGLVGWVGFMGNVIVSAFNEDRQKRLPFELAKQATDYLTEIGYPSRPDPRLVRSDDASPNPYWATGQYDPDEFSRIRRTHSSYEQNAMRDYGMTADEWDANRPD